MFAGAARMLISKMVSAWLVTILLFLSWWCMVTAMIATVTFHIKGTTNHIYMQEIRCNILEYTVFHKTVERVDRQWLSRVLFS